MLERKFGTTKARSSAFLDERGKPIIGTVDAKGNLVTQGPKKRFVLRMVQILLAGTAAIPSIYAAIVIKQPHPGDPPPPANKPAAFVLYILSVLTLLLLLYLFVFRPCCCCSPRKKGKDAENPLLGNGMMVLPVPGSGGGGGKKKGGGGGKRGKKGGKGKGGGGGGDVQVNLIVDPHAFNFGHDHDEDDNAGPSDDDGGMPGSFSLPKPRSKGRGRQRRRGILAGLAMEESWRHARGWAKKLAIVDVAGVVLWGAAFVLILLGKRCPSGAFSGWYVFFLLFSLFSHWWSVTLTDSPSFAWIQVQCIQRLLSRCTSSMCRFWR